MNVGLVLSGAVLVVMILFAVVAMLLPEADVNCGICGGTRHFQGRPCPRCNSSPEI